MMWPRGRKAVVLGIAAALLLLGGVGWYFFAPKPTRTLAEPAPVGTLIKSGIFQDGEPLHEAEGSVRLLSVDGGHVLRFEDFEATSGPDVYLYLTPAARASTVAEVEGAGVKVRTPTSMGQATLRGDFNLEVPEGLDVSRYMGVAIWCDTYNVLFGYAELAQA